MENNMGSKNSNGEIRYEAFIVEDTLLKKYNGIDDYVRLPGFIYIICSCAFAGNDKFKSISLSCNVKEIGDFAFQNCISLSEIIFDGTKAHWSQIKKGEKIFEGTTGNLIIRCMDGEITKQKEIDSDPKTNPEIAEMLAILKREGEAERIKLKEIQDKKDRERQEYQSLFEGAKMSDAELCRKVLEFFVTKGSATVLTVASEYKIDYVRARCLIDWLELNGYIKASVEGLRFAPYETLITFEEFKKFFDVGDGGTEDKFS